MHNIFQNYYGIATTETQSIKKDAGIEGKLEYGQKNISTIKRNLLNADEILRLPYNKLIVNIRGNKPIILDKIIYTEHELYAKLKDNPIGNYKPKWNTNVNNIVEKDYSKKVKSNEKKEPKEITFDSF